MKKYFLLTLLAFDVFFVTAQAIAFSDVGTHPDITQAAALQSDLKTTNYLNDNLGFKKGLDEIILETSILNTLRNGAQTEDSGVLPAKPEKMCDRGLNHFYDPTKISGGLDEVVNISTTPLKYLALLLPSSYGGMISITPVYPFHGYENPSWAIKPQPGSDWCPTTANLDLQLWQGVYSEDDELSSNCNAFSWSWARASFVKALITKEEPERNRLFARMFRSIGQMVHLMQDMAVPAHVRNDMQGHLYFQKIFFNAFGYKNIYSIPGWMGNNFEAYVFDKATNLGLIHGGGAVPSLGEDESVRTFWDSNTYRNHDQGIDNIGSGLAEYTAANFLSQNKMLDAYKHPSANDGGVSMWPKKIQAEDGKYDYRYYFSMEQGSPKVEHLAASSVLNSFLPIYIHSFDYLDDECHKEYASYLVPKAVDYSTGLINYFFRGTLEIERPDRYVYSIADGSITPQQFTYIKAKVKNSTDYNGGGEAPMGPGKLWAVAKYKWRTTYCPYLDYDPPGADDRDSFFSYSISVPKEGVTLNTESQEFEFDFSGDPIPAGITDLYLQVVYQGTLGNEADTAVAVGMKDLNEPTHFGFFNNTDFMYFQRALDCDNGCVSQGNMFAKPEDIVDTCKQNDHCDRPIQCDPEKNRSNPDGDGRLHCVGGCGYPVDMQVQIAFYPIGYDPPNPFHVSYNNMPAGRYGRVLLLSDSSLEAVLVIRPIAGQFPWVENNMENYPCDIAGFPTLTFPGVDVPAATYQDDATGHFVAVPDIKEFRGVRFHSFEFIRAAFDIEIPPSPYDAAWPFPENAPAVEVGNNNINK